MTEQVTDVLTEEKQSLPSPQNTPQTTPPKGKAPLTIGQKLAASWKGYLFILPVFVFLLTFSYFPAISGIFHSFFDWKSSGEKAFIGIANYKEFLSDLDVFWPSVGRMFILLLPKILINVVCPLVVAELIFNLRSDKSKSFFRLWVLIPVVAPGVVTTLLWGYIYDPQQGIITMIWQAFGGEPIAWLDDSRTVIPAIIFMGFPWIGGTSVLIYISGLNSVSAEARESARLEGAGTYAIIWYIDLPHILGQVKFFAINGIIAGLQDYSVQFLLTKGGPGYDTMVPGYYMYQAAFQQGRMGYASAIGTFLFVITMIFTLILFSTGKKKGDEI